MQVDEATYLRAANTELNNLLTALDVFEGEFETELSNDILSLEFAKDDKCIINGHRAARQIWLAANRRAWHFDLHPDGHFRATKTGEELWQLVEGLVTDKLKRGIRLARPKVELPLP